MTTRNGRTATANNANSATKTTTAPSAKTTRRRQRPASHGWRALQRTISTLLIFGAGIALAYDRNEVMEITTLRIIWICTYLCMGTAYALLAGTNSPKLIFLLLGILIAVTSGNIFIPTLFHWLSYAIGSVLLTALACSSLRYPDKERRMQCI